MKPQGRANPPDLVITYDPGVPTGLPGATRRALLAMPAVEPHRPGTGPCDATIIVVTENDSAQAMLCLLSILAHTAGENYELVISRAESRGHIAAWNQALALASGRVVVLISEDCLVPPGWLPRLMAQLEDRAIGLVGPVSNRASNESQILAAYSTYGEFVAFANRREPSQPVDLRTLNMFCVGMRREVYEAAGAFDERLDVGMFQEEDYAIRVRNLGYRVVCAPDVFVHNGGRSAIGHLTSAGLYGDRFQDVRRAFEEKWAVRWYAHDYFNASAYDLLRRIRGVILQSIPPDATVLVVSRGDEEILTLAPHAWHFPRLDDGTYAGHHPADSAEAIAHLELQRSKGADFLLIPNSSAWWLTHYDGWRQYLEDRYPAIGQDERTCVVFDLRTPRTG